MNRDGRVEVAAETDRIVAAGGYEAGGRTIDIAQAVEAAAAATHLHRPDDPALAAARRHDLAGRTEVTAETSLAAAARLHAEDPSSPVGCLNFASAKHPGGGYRSGAQAQEESLARSSALVACLDRVPEFYAHHLRQRDLRYSDRVICSPGVPVFRNDDGELLAEPYPVTFLTSAAPNAGALRDHGQEQDLSAVLAARGRQVLAAAVLHDVQRLVLGAWGCGVFRNDPAVVATMFAALLRDEFPGAFEQVTFAVFDPASGKPTRQAFEAALG